MKTSNCTHDRAIVRRPAAEDARSRDLHRLAEQAQMLRSSDSDHFVRTTLRVEELTLRVEGPRLAPTPPSRAHHCGNGYANGVGGGDVSAAQRARLAEIEQLTSALSQLKSDYHDWRAQNPGATEPTNGARSLGEILDDKSLSTGELCVHIMEVVFHERPETADELCATIPSHEVPSQEMPGQAPSGGPPANTEISRGIFSAFGMGANLLGGLLQSPLAVPLLGAACAVIPGAQVLLPFLPIIAPIAGMALSGVGGMASQVGQGQAPDLDLGNLASPDMLASLLPAVTGMLGGAAGVPGAGAAAVMPLPAT